MYYGKNYVNSKGVHDNYENNDVDGDGDGYDDVV